MPDFTLPKEQRLHGKRAIDALFAGGSYGYAHPFKYRFTLQKTGGPTAILVSVPKKLHKRAVRRNLLKRRTKESYRQCKHMLTDALAEKGVAANIAFIYGSKEILDYRTIDNAVHKILESILSRS